MHVVSMKALVSPGFCGVYDRLGVLCMRSSRTFLVKQERKGSHVVGLSHPAQFRETALRSVPCMLKCSNQLLLLVFTLSLNLSVVLSLAKTCGLSWRS